MDNIEPLTEGSFCSITIKWLPDFRHELDFNVIILNPYFFKKKLIPYGQFFFKENTNLNQSQIIVSITL